MKPSERIIKIMRRDTDTNITAAIMAYLDEEFKKSCNHRIVKNVCSECDCILKV